MTHNGSEQPCEPSPESSALVPVIFAANRAEAKFYQTLLEDAGIQATIDTDADQQTGRPGKGVAVLVHPELLDDATDVITVREEMEAHILAGPDGRDKDDDEDEEELSPRRLDDDNTEDEEDILFRRDPFMDEDGD